MKVCFIILVLLHKIYYIHFFYCSEIYKNIDDLVALNYALEGGIESQNLW